jgi:acyl dehydratase
MTAERIEYKLVATMDTSRPVGGNSIHSDAGAQGFGFRSALVVGGYVYAWAVPAILDALGNEWLGRGWVSIQFRRPVHVGDELIVLSTKGPEATAAIRVQNQRQEGCLVGDAGLNDAPGLRNW